MTIRTSEGVVRGFYFTGIDLDKSIKFCERLLGISPTEITAKAGEILQLAEVVNAWLIVTNGENVMGWIPAECVVNV